ncbi:Chromosome segregation protein Spo0J, contains ParB-like nuclease domain [Streptomyces sp. WMMB 714]|nr:Chromosome segregation protein Spo0J, contains ParB-like nuclease domain [Streptomyces sp. WMMB 714]
MRDGGLNDSPVELVSTEKLTASYSPRTEKKDTEYARKLADLAVPLPPIVVHRQTMKVIDGFHRLLAARLIGVERIAVRFFDGSEENASLLAVALNTTHGRPLTLAERTAAAERILARHPQWSDRAVATVAGLSPGKVSQVRRNEQQETERAESRVGRDGRVRPLNTSQGRKRASELLKANPQATLRQVASMTGISAATVADVRNRMRRGLPPVPPRQQEKGTRKLAVSPAAAAQSAVADRTPSPALASLSQVLRKDPSLRFNDAGRTVLRMLEACTVVERERKQIMACMPAHCRELISELMYGYAEICRSIAQELQEGADTSRQTG